MARYVTQAVECGDDWMVSDITRLDVLVMEDTPVDTGLLDQFGQRLFRLPERHPIGFRSRTLTG